MSFINEKIVETKICTHCGTSFDITDKDSEFYEKVSPIFGWKKYSIPTPKFCPTCRQQRRLAFRNERSMYKRTCDATWESIISTYSPESKYKVYSSDYWWSDAWDIWDTVQEYDATKSALTQFNELLLKVPHLWASVVNGENSEYNSFAQDVSNCYLNTRIASSEHIYYSYLVYQESTDCFDCFNVKSGNNNYEAIDCMNCSSAFYSTQCLDSYNLVLCFNCKNCQNCFGSIGLDGKSYYYFNEALSKEEYEEKMSSLQLWNASEFQKLYAQFMKIKNNSIFKENVNISSQDCVWDYIVKSKNVCYWFDCNEIEDGKYINGAIFGKNQFDTDFNYFWENTLEQLSCWKAQNSLFSFGSFNSSHVLYSFNCYNSSHIFLCSQLRDKQYCILNKQYSKEQYEELVPKIIEKMQEDWEWWEFFPSSMSPFGYNETVASEYFPLDKNKATQQWFYWSDYEAPFPKVAKIILAQQLPDDISDIPDDILNWAIECEVTKKPFRIIPQELEFYRKHSLPIPKRHPDQRHLDRVALRNPKKLFNRNCHKCSVDIKTTYSPDRPEKVYCEECYNNEIY